MPAVRGSVDLSGFHASPAGNAFDVRYTLGGDAHAFDGFANDPGTEEMKKFTAREFTETADGLVAWDTRFVGATRMQGAAGITLAAAGVPAEGVAREQAEAFFLAGTNARFVDGSIHLPARASTG